MGFLKSKILYQLGGLYVDCDLECVAPVEDLHAVLGFYTGMSNTGTMEVNNGLIG
jgi:mannosyltransferase OCH1-like enzyme